MKIRIGSHLVNVIEQRLPTDENCDGLTDWDDSTILIEANLSDTAFTATLIHEILEFINECTDELIFPPNEENKEQKISTLAEFLVPMMKNSFTRRDKQ